MGEPDHAAPFRNHRVAKTVIGENGHGLGIRGNSQFEAGIAHAVPHLGCRLVIEGECQNLVRYGRHCRGSNRSTAKGALIPHRISALIPSEVDSDVVAWNGRQVDFRTSCLCAVCFRCWMCDLETRVRPVFGSMIRRQSVRLEREVELCLRPAEYEWRLTAQSVADFNRYPSFGSRSCFSLRKAAPPARRGGNCRRRVTSAEAGMVKQCCHAWLPTRVGSH